MYHICSIGNVPSIYNAWFVGDEFLRSTFPMFIEMKQEAAIRKREVPYLHAYYNVFAYTTSTSSGNCRTIGRIFNSLVHRLNTRDRLPRFLVVVTDKDIIEDVNVFEYGAGVEIMKNIEWLFKQIEIVIRHKHTELINARPGAVYMSDPKIIAIH